MTAIAIPQRRILWPGLSPRLREWMLRFMPAFGRVFPPPFATAGAAAVVLPWWNPDGATPGGIGGACLGAWRGIATIGSPWGAGPANLAASYVNLANPGTNDLTVVSAPTWTAAAGWYADGADALDTGIFPTDAQSMLVQFANNATGAWGCIAGAETPPGYLARCSIFPTYFGSYDCIKGVTDRIIGAGAKASGNLGIAGLQCYDDGAPSGAPCNPATGAYTNTIYLLDINGEFWPGYIGDVWGFALYSTTLTGPQMLARATAMAAL